MLAKKEQKGKCPFRDFKVCSEKCVLYRKGVRYSKDGTEVTPVEVCAFNVMADNLEMTHNRIFQLQSEVGETKNIMAMKMLIDMKMGTFENENTLKRTIHKIVFTDKAKAITEK
jgi:hypothetical protein